MTAKATVRVRQGGRTLPEIALDVHAAVTGSADRDPAARAADVDLLRAALESWEASAAPAAARFDEAVRQLVLAAVAEADAAVD
jgi:hypothetical protein